LTNIGANAFSDTALEGSSCPPASWPSANSFAYSELTNTVFGANVAAGIARAFSFARPEIRGHPAACVPSARRLPPLRVR
jgi:hypothetical protein